MAPKSGIVQLPDPATVVPAKAASTIATIRVLEQTPHSLFWDYDAIGYISMGLATMLAVPALENTGFEKWVRMSLIANAAVTPLISIVYFYRPFSARLLWLGFPWGITAPLFMIMLAIALRRRSNSEISSRLD